METRRSQGPIQNKKPRLFSCSGVGRAIFSKPLENFQMEKRAVSLLFTDNGIKKQLPKSAKRYRINVQSTLSNTKSNRNRMEKANLSY